MNKKVFNEITSYIKDLKSDNTKDLNECRNLVNDKLLYILEENGFYDSINVNLDGHEPMFEGNFKDFINSKYFKDFYYFHPLFKTVKSLSIFLVNQFYLTKNKSNFFKEDSFSIENFEDIANSFKCTLCDEYIHYMFDIETNSFILHPNSFHNKCIENYETIEYEYNFPTGVLYIFDTLSEIFNIEIPLNFFSKKGKLEHILSLKKRNILLFNCDNETPTFFKKDNNITIGKGVLVKEISDMDYKEWIDYAGESTFNEEMFNLYKNYDLGIDCGSIMTDNSFFEIIDEKYLNEMFIEKRINGKEFLEENDFIKIIVEPGKYQIKINDIYNNEFDKTMNKIKKFEILKI